MDDDDLRPAAGILAALLLAFPCWLVWLILAWTLARCV